jgi:hypothetical protein
MRPKTVPVDQPHFTSPPRRCISPSSTVVFMGLLVVITCGDRRVWVVDVGRFEVRKEECELNLLLGAESFLRS